LLPQSSNTTTTASSSPGFFIQIFQVKKWILLFFLFNFLFNFYDVFSIFIMTLY
jgi:hypothetical protein